MEESASPAPFTNTMAKNNMIVDVAELFTRRMKFQLKNGKTPREKVVKALKAVSQQETFDATKLVLNGLPTSN